VEVPVSSMKIKRAGSRSGWPSNQALAFGPYVRALLFARVRHLFLCVSR
jgi:hypothetical protein